MNNENQFQPHEIKWDDQKIIRMWDYYSQSKSHQYKYFGRQSGKEVASILNKKIFGKIESIIDFSCGKGDLLKACLPYLNNNQKIFAADISKSSIEETLAKINNYSGFLGSCVIEKFPTSLTSDRFDLVIFTEVIEHLNDNQLYIILDEIQRITKPGGFVFITTPYEEDLQAEKTICPDCGCIFHRWQHLRSWSIEKLISTTSNHGFKAIECKNIQWGPLLLKIYFKIISRAGNGIYYIGQKTLF